MDMTNDFVFEKYEHEGKEYEGKLVASLAKTIVEPIAALVRKVMSSGTVSLFRLSKDHYDAFTNPELELRIAELGINEVFMTGLADEICIYRNILGFLERDFQIYVVKGCTAPFDLNKGKKGLKELEACGAKTVDDIPEDIGIILLLEDEHNESSQEIKSGSWPPHNMKGTPGSLTVKPIREALEGGM